MPLPVKFDENEIFISIIGLLLSAIMLVIFPKRFPYSISIIIYLFNISIGIAADHFLAGPPLDFYDVLDEKKFELFDLILYLFVYGPSTYIIIYIYDKWFFHRSHFAKLIFLLFISTTNTGLEYIAHLLHVFTYKSWEIYYSFFIYLLVYFLNFLLLKLLKNNKQNQLYSK